MKTLLKSLCVSMLAVACTSEVSLGVKESDTALETDSTSLQAVPSDCLQKIEASLTAGLTAGNIATVDKAHDKEYNDSGFFPLHRASMYGDLALVQRLVALGAKLDAQTEQKRTPLHYACLEGHSEIVQYLKDQGADIEKQDSTGGTAVLFAARNGRLAMLQYLKEAGANMQVEDSDGCNILHSAAASNDVALFDYCMEALGPASKSMLEGKKDLPLSWAAEVGSVAIIEKILAANPNLVNAQDSLGETALHTAAQNGDLATVQCLVAHGADPDIENKRGFRAARQAQGAQRGPIVELLLRTVLDKMSDTDEHPEDSA